MGSYSSKAGAASCSPCDVGSFVGVTGATACFSCTSYIPATSTTSIGSADASACVILPSSCRSGEAPPRGVGAVFTTSACLPLNCDGALVPVANNLSCTGCRAGRFGAPPACAPCPPAAACPGFTLDPLHTPAGLVGAISDLVAQGGAGGGPSCPALASWLLATPVIPPTLPLSAQFGGSSYLPFRLVMLSFALTLIVLTMASCALVSANALAAASGGGSARKPSARVVALSAWATASLKQIDMFSLHHVVRDGAIVESRSTASGGACTVLGFTTLFALAVALALIRLDNNQLLVFSLSGLTPAVLAAAGTQNVSSTDVVNASAPGGVSTLTGLTLVVTAEGEGDACSAFDWNQPVNFDVATPLSATAVSTYPYYFNASAGAPASPGLAWDYDQNAMFDSGAFSASRFACDLGPSAAAPPLSVSGRHTAGQLVLSCPACVLASDETLAVQLKVALHWSCQTLLVRALSSDSNSALYIVSLNMSAADNESPSAFARSATWYVEPLLTIRNDTALQLPPVRGYQLLPGALVVARDLNNQSLRLLPTDNVTLTIAIELSPLLAATEVQERQTLLQLLTTIVGLSGVIGAFGLAFMHGEWACSTWACCGSRKGRAGGTRTGGGSARYALRQSPAASEHEGRGEGQGDEGGAFSRANPLLGAALPLSPSVYGPRGPGAPHMVTRRARVGALPLPSPPPLTPAEAAEARDAVIAAVLARADAAAKQRECERLTKAQAADEQLGRLRESEDAAPAAKTGGRGGVVTVGARKGAAVTLGSAATPALGAGAAAGSTKRRTGGGAFTTAALLLTQAGSGKRPVSAAPLVAAASGGEAAEAVAEAVSAEAVVTEAAVAAAAPANAAAATAAAPQAALESFLDGLTKAQIRVLVAAGAVSKPLDKVVRAVAFSDEVLDRFSNAERRKLFALGIAKERAADV